MTQPVFRLLMVCFGLIALAPLSLLAVHMYREAWNDAWRGVEEKHRLLAENLAVPVANYVHDHVAVLDHLAQQLATRAGNPADADAVIGSALGTIRGFRSLILLDARGVVQTMRDPILPANATTRYRSAFGQEPSFLSTRANGQPTVSTVHPSPLSGTPAIFLAQPVVAPNGKLAGVLLGELRIEPIEEIRRGLRLGETGHAAIVDRAGRVIAHPNPAWMDSIHDLSNLEIVQRVLNGETGVMEFRSPSTDEVMVAGYFPVPGLGWGVLVPQPKREIERHANAVIRSHLTWAGLGLLLAAALAIPLARWITAPINRLASTAARLLRPGSKRRLPARTKWAPYEVIKLEHAFAKLVENLQTSESQLRKTNRSLSKRVRRSTKELREKNRQLIALAQMDHLTGLFNRRYFEIKLHELVEEARSGAGEHVLLYTDLDRFKEINDRCGHIAGDALLRQLAELMLSTVREGDAVARVGGDEFGILLADCDLDEGIHIAETLRQKIDGFTFPWGQREFRLTASIGVIALNESSGSFTDCLRQADLSCYAAKTAGKDRIHVYRPAIESADGNEPSRQETLRLV